MNPPTPAAKAMKLPLERRWLCRYCGSTYVEYVNGCPRCYLGEVGTATSVVLVGIIPSGWIDEVESRAAVLAADTDADGRGR